MITTVSAYGRAGASARVRVFDWLDHTRTPAESLTYLDGSRLSLGEIAHRPLATLKAERVLRAVVNRAPATPVLLSRGATPFSNGGIESALLRAATIGVYDFDDALMHQTGSGTRRAFSRAKVWLAATRAADRVIAGNEYLADYAAHHNADVRVIPSCVEPSRYQEKSSYSIAESPVAVWMGSPSTEQYLQDIARPLQEAHRRFGLRLRLISAGNAQLHGLEMMTDRVQWDPTTYGTELQNGDFGIMPLPDDPWTRGKCAYKLLQYGAAALPVIASPVGANVKALSQMKGFAASTEDDWLDALATLVGATSQARSEYGTAAREAVVAHYSFARWKSTWLDAVLNTN